MKLIRKVQIPTYYLMLALIFISACLMSCDGKKQNTDKNSPSDNLKIVIIRHAEKPDNGDNLSCQGQNRALQLAEVLHAKLDLPENIYVPALKSSDATKHSRMFQTISPFAIKYNLTINSKYSADETEKIAKNVFKKDGLVLMVWAHSEIQGLANALGVNNAPQWADGDFDSIWVINYQDGEASFSIDRQNINPAIECNY